MQLVSSGPLKATVDTGCIVLSGIATSPVEPLGNILLHSVPR